MSISYPNPRYPSKVLRGTVQITSSNKTLGFRDPVAPANYTHDMPETDVVLWGPGPGTANISGSLENHLLDAINAIIETITGGTTGGDPNEVIINSDGKVEVTINRTPAVAFYFRPNGYGGNGDYRWFGLDPDDPEYQFPAATGTYIFPYTVWPQWIPAMYDSRDTGDMRVFCSTQSKTASMRPNYLEWADEIIMREIEWETVAGARIRSVRAADSVFTDNAALTVDDPNAALEVLIDFLLSGDSTVYPGAVYVIEDVESGSTFEGVGLYYVLLEESKLLTGVQEENLNKDSGLEMFSVQMKFRGL